MSDWNQSTMLPTGVATIVAPPPSLKDAPSASLLPAGNPAPPADCHLTYKSEAVFTSLHLTKDAPQRIPTLKKDTPSK